MEKSNVTTLPNAKVKKEKNNIHLTIMTTIVLVRKNKDVVVASDGQVSMGNTVIKSTANKVRKIEKRNVIAGFAGSTADALTLFERLESKLELLISSNNLYICIFYNET